MVKSEEDDIFVQFLREIVRMANINSLRIIIQRNVDTIPVLSHLFYNKLIVRLHITYCNSEQILCLYVNLYLSETIAILTALQYSSLFRMWDLKKLIFTLGYSQKVQKAHDLFSISFFSDSIEILLQLAEMTNCITSSDQSNLNSNLNIVLLANEILCRKCRHLEVFIHTLLASSFEIEQLLQVSLLWNSGGNIFLSNKADKWEVMNKANVYSPLASHPNN